MYLTTDGILGSKKYLYFKGRVHEENEKEIGIKDDSCLDQDGGVGRS